MAQDTRSSKELLVTILSKCKDALPQVATIMSRLDRQNQPAKIRKRDCLNPRFLQQLSDCGESIKVILLRALEQDLERQSLRRYYMEYMQVISQIRKYHKEAHLSHNMHVNSTTMKENLLDELKGQTFKRKELEKQLDFLRKELADRDVRIRELQELLEAKQSNINISQISNISKRVKGNYGELYGGESRVGQIQEDEDSVYARKLRKRIIELEGIIDEKELEHKNQRQRHQQELEEQKKAIIEFETYVQQMQKANKTEAKSKKADNFKQNIKTNATSRQTQCNHDDFFRFLMIQSSTIQLYLQQNEDD